MWVITMFTTGLVAFGCKRMIVCVDDCVCVMLCHVFLFVDSLVCGEDAIGPLRGEWQQCHKLGQLMACRCRCHVWNFGGQNPKSGTWPSCRYYYDLRFHHVSNNLAHANQNRVLAHCVFFCFVASSEPQKVIGWWFYTCLFHFPQY